MYARQGIGTENEERERMNILVCDDDREIVEAIEIYLSQEGYHILKAYDGMQALKVMEQAEDQGEEQYSNHYSVSQVGGRG